MLPEGSPIPSILARLLGLLALAPALVAADADTLEPAVVLENPHLRYLIAANGQNLAFLDRRNGTNYLRPGVSSCAWIRQGQRQTAVSSVRLESDRLTLQFGEAGPTAVLRVESQPSAIQVSVESLTRADEIDALGFLDLPLTLAGKPDDPFGACAYSLNLHTRVDALPALQTHLRASAERKFGILGAKVALVGVPVPQMLPALKTVLAAADEMPRCTVAGPWAQEIPFNHGSYLFNFGTLVETNVEEWIGMARSLAFTQIDNHGGGGFFRFGDLELNRKKWPDGWDTWTRLVQRLHDAGIGSILHTYAFFIDKQSRYVTPVPDRRLDAFRAFTLSADLAPDATEIPVEESTAGLSTVTGFFEHNSVVLHLGDELVTFSGFTKEPPWRFTGIQRGAHGTRAAAHTKGSRARHLKECFGLFVPDAESTLFEEIAANHAEVVNKVGFDGIYLDAIDGCSILRGPDECWYWGDKFVFEIQRRLKRPVGMEMSAMWHHCWQYRTRWQAWDLPQRGHVRFVDQHAESVNGGLLLPLHLGWWGFQSFQPPQIEPTFPNIMATVGARLVGWDAGLSLTAGVDREKLRTVPLFRRAVDLLRQSEELRRSGSVDAATRAKLREPGRGFAMVTTNGATRFQRSELVSHAASFAVPSSLAWSITNPFPAQPLRLRLEALMSAPSEPGTNAILLGNLGSPSPAWELASAQGVSVKTVSGTEAVTGGSATWLTATNAGLVPQRAAWTRFQQRFPAPRDLKHQQALGFWIDGDASGALLAVRLESPKHLAFGAVADRYLPLDFRGPRFVTLVETESERWSDYQWDDGKGLYNVYRETIEFGAVETVSVWLQNLPAGRETRVGVGPVFALPMVPATVKNPTLTVNGHAVELPADLLSGQWIEIEATSEATVYGPQGETLSTLSLKPNRMPE
ncbi:MAG: hypothetical protein IT580_07760, partial [Verrucomicrobiales bacterium]|nr:hypothetical protein [Verrucomicrobiales bacterium]